MARLPGSRKQTSEELQTLEQTRPHVVLVFSRRCDTEILSLPRFLEMVGRDLANLSLISTSRKSDMKQTKVNCLWEREQGEHR